MGRKESNKKKTFKNNSKVLDYSKFWNTTDRRQWKTLILPTGDKWHSKTLFLATHDQCLSIVKSIFDCRLSGVWKRDLDLGKNCIQNFHLRYMYIIVFSHKFSVMMTYQHSHKTLFAAINRMKYTSPNENFGFSYPYFNALLHLVEKSLFFLNSERCCMSCTEIWLQ